MYVSDSMTTQLADIGMTLISSDVVLRTWSANYHEDGAVIDSESELTVWSMTSLGNLRSDFTGDGTVNYGTTQMFDVEATVNDNRLWETTVYFEDLW